MSNRKLIELELNKPRVSKYNLEEIISRASYNKDENYSDYLEIILCLANKIKEQEDIMRQHGIF